MGYFYMLIIGFVILTIGINYYIISTKNINNASAGNFFLGMISIILASITTASISFILAMAGWEIGILIINPITYTLILIIILYKQKKWGFLKGVIFIVIMIIFIIIGELLLSIILK